MRSNNQPLAQRQNADIGENASPPEEVLRADISRNGKLFQALMSVTKTECTRWMAQAWNACRTSPRLLAADRYTLLVSLAEAAYYNLDISPSSGMYYLIPTKSKDHGDRTIVSGRVGYQGLLELARRDNELSRIYVDVVRSGDRFAHRGGTDPRIEHEHAVESGPGYELDDAITHAYCVAWFGKKEPQFSVVRRKAILEARSLSGNPKDPTAWTDVWSKHFEAMAKVVSIRRAAKHWPRGRVRTAALRDSEREAGIDPGPIDDQISQIEATPPPSNELEALQNRAMPGEAGA